MARFFVIILLFVNAICQAGSGADSYTIPWHAMSCTGIPPYDMSYHVRDRDGEKGKTREGQDEARDGRHRIHAASNRSNRTTYAIFFNIIESELPSLNIFWEMRKRNFLTHNLYWSRVRFDNPIFFSAEFDEYVHAVLYNIRIINLSSGASKWKVMSPKRIICNSLICKFHW